MIPSLRKNLSRIGLALGLMSAVATGVLLNSCNDTGTSPYAPSISYKRLGISAALNVAIVPDSAFASGTGVINGYSISPALPAGLTLNTKNGIISGTPTETSPSVNYIVTASGSSGAGTDTVTICVSNASQVCNVGKGPVAPIISFRGIGGLKNAAITPDTVLSTGGAINSYSITPALPANLTFNTASGIISGTPIALDTPGRSFTVTATGPSGTAQTVVSICVGTSSYVCDTRAPYTPYIRPFIWTMPNVAIMPDTPFSYGGKFLGYAVSPALPAGLVLNPVNGIISGTPTATDAAKEYKIVVNGPFGIDTEYVSIAIVAANFPTQLLDKGMARFQGACTGCHNMDGKGSPGGIPPIFHSDFMMADKSRIVRIQLLGVQNPTVDPDAPGAIITVNGVDYNGSMSPQGGNDSDIAAVLTFERTLLNGATDFISPAFVGRIRDSLTARCTAIGPTCGWAPDPGHNN